MKIVPLTLEQANNLVESLHRHHKRVLGHRYSLGCMSADRLVGAAIVGRPVARLVPAYSVAEVSRLVTDGTPNACSFLYSACARVAREMGFDRIQTYILNEEPGTSLVAAGWQMDPVASGGGTWNRPSRGGRRDDQPLQAKKRFSKELKK